MRLLESTSNVRGTPWAVNTSLTLLGVITALCRPIVSFSNEASNMTADQ